MARAKRHYIPGQIWHLTHRCHKREFLLKLVMDRRRWVQWLFEAKRRYGLVILNYTVTSNHIHLLVLDEEGRAVIPQSIKYTFRKAHKELVSESLSAGINCRQTQWTESIAVGSKSFVDMVKEKLGIRAKGRKILENGGGFQLREDMGTDIANFDSKKDDIGAQNTYYWDISH